MTTEEKAKAYDEALERAKEIKSKILSSHLSIESCKAVSEYIDTIIPELRESEDEKIRKEMIEFFQCSMFCDELDTEQIKRWVSWLEKQKEQKPIIQDVELNDAVYDYVRDHFIAGADFTPEYIKKLMENAFFAGVDYYLLKQEFESSEPDTNVEKVIEDVIRVYGKTQGEWVGGYDVDTLIVNLRRAFNKKEQKPAEWSEEDENYLGVIIRLVEQVSGWPERAITEYTNWLKSLRRPKSSDNWKPVSEDLEEELERRYEQAKWGYVDGFGETVMDKEQFTRIARHFAEWGAEHLHDSTKKISEDVEEAADKYAEKLTSEPYLQIVHKTDFIAGAEWQKAKMMEGAVEGFVGVHLHDKRADVTVNSGYLPKEMGIKSDSKVKIIIVKEDNNGH